jgi:hypothetical protein
MADRPPGRDAAGGPLIQPSRPRYSCHASPPRSQQEGTAAASVSPGADSGRERGGQAAALLPYDQIDPARLVIGDATGRLDGHLGVLGVALAQWMARDDTRPQPAVRQAANTAMDTVDEMLRELHALRSRLLGEVRASDDLAAARADQLLAKLREEAP